ncbi:MAG: HD domain-containing phosphohydrolase [Candidatus Omnitrophota bacterium]
MTLNWVRSKNNLSYLDVFNFLPEEALLIDPKDYTIIDINDSFLKSIGKSRDEIIGRKCFEVTHKRNRPCRGALESCPLKETLKTHKAVKVEHIHYDKNKNPHYIEVITSLIKSAPGKRNILLHISRSVPLLNHLHSSIRAASKKYLSKLKNLTTRDNLTGVYNYQYVMERLPAEIYRAKRYGASFSMALIDIDYFKSINDNYGYQVGDVLLADFAHFIKRLLRKSDILARYSGEEFIILMPYADKLDCLYLANRLIAKISAHTFRIKGMRIKVKMSVGAATLSDDSGCNSRDKLLNAVDKALQRAKEGGGNIALSFSDLYSKKRLPAHKMNTYEEIHALKRKLKKLSDSVDQVVLESIYAFSKSLEARDDYTAEHAEDMVSLVLKLGNELGLSKEMLDSLEKGAMLHDIGKIGISDAILRKKSKLTQHEYRIIKTHPKIGAEIIRAIHFLKDVVPIVLHHHERWDGKGYPSGLKEREIPILARIVSITDAYQALTSDRPYRKAYSKKEAFKILRAEANQYFDKDLVDTLIRIESESKRRNARKH